MQEWGVLGGWVNRREKAPAPPCLSGLSPVHEHLDKKTSGLSS